MVAGNGDRHEIRPTGLLTRRSYPSAGRAVEAGCGAQIWGQARCSVLLISNVQRPTFNSQRSMGRPKGRMVAGNGDRHEIRMTGLLTCLTYPSAGRAVEAGCGTQIWGQARCPIYRSGTFNVQLSTFNGVTEMAHGGREWGQTRNSDDRAFDPPELPKRRSGGRCRLRRPDMGTDTMSDMPIKNV